MRYSIDKISTIIGAQRYGTREASVSFLLTDSRSLCFPEETLFFALKTERNDGHLYVAELYRRGVRNFVVNRQPSEVFDDANFLVVADTLKALQQLAASHRAAFDVPVVGITGSNGKTMVKEWLSQLLGDHVTRSPRSYNSQIGVPLSVWLLNEQSEIGIFEAGISLRAKNWYFLAMPRRLSIAPTTKRSAERCRLPISRANIWRGRNVGRMSRCSSNRFRKKRRKRR